MLVKLADALDLHEVAALTGDQAATVSAARPKGHEAVPAIRETIEETVLVVDREQHYDVDALVDRAAYAWRVGHTSATPRADVGRVLPSLLRDARRAARVLTGPDRRTANTALVAAYALAEQALAWVSDSALLWLSADRRITAAEQADDPASLAAAAWVVGNVWRSTGRGNEALRLAVGAADVLAPYLDGDDDNMRALWGACRLHAAITAARLGGTRFVTLATPTRWCLASPMTTRTRGRCSATRIPTSPGHRSQSTSVRAEPRSTRPKQSTRTWSRHAIIRHGCGWKPHGRTHSNATTPARFTRCNAPRRRARSRHAADAAGTVVTRVLTEPLPAIDDQPTTLLTPVPARTYHSGRSSTATHRCGPVTGAYSRCRQGGHRSRPHSAGASSTDCTACRPPAAAGDLFPSASSRRRTPHKKRTIPRPTPWPGAPRTTACPCLTRVIRGHSPRAPLAGTDGTDELVELASFNGRHGPVTPAQRVYSHFLLVFKDGLAGGHFGRLAIQYTIPPACSRTRWRHPRAIDRAFSLPRLRIRRTSARSRAHSARAFLIGRRCSLTLPVTTFLSVPSPPSPISSATSRGGRP